MDHVRSSFLKIAIGCSLASCLWAQSHNNPLPRIEQKYGGYALFVDGAPYLMLSAQVNNSSAWPSMLPKVWPAIADIHANTVEMPVYWEQFEPQPGQFDYSVLDTILAQAQEHHIHLVLLWFGTWKNGSPDYMPDWMKLAPERYPRMVGADGRVFNSPSPNAPATLAEDIRAFTTLMRHLKEADPQHTVLMIQVENETGSWGGTVRDHSPAAQKLFEAPVPAAVLRAMHKEGASAGANWEAVFGPDAEEYFDAWSVGSYVGKVAAAGKAVYPLPMYVNDALRDPLHPGPARTYDSGGPTDNVIPIWKAAAPALDLLAPDIYLRDSVRYLKVLDLYGRPDNALLVPETGSSPGFARYFFAALGHQAIGFSPFGIDYTAYADTPIGASRENAESLAQFALNYELIGPMDRDIALLNFDGKLKAVAEEDNQEPQTLEFGRWKATISYGAGRFGRAANPAAKTEPLGRALVAQLAGDQFLVAGFYCHVNFAVADSASQKHRQYLKVEEGAYKNGVFRPFRLWNGDQVTWGLNFTSAPQVLRVTLGTY